MSKSPIQVNNIHSLTYNTEKKPLIIPEYGRHVQDMVDYLVSITDQEKQNTFAKYIINVMGNLQPHLRDVSDFQHKLWDQLMIMSDFQLGSIASPFPLLTKEQKSEKPQPLPYPQNFPKYRFYGNTISRMIDVAVHWQEGEQKDILIRSIANHMKKSYLNWNKDTVEDSVIFLHLYDLSNGKIDLRDAGEENSLSTPNSLPFSKSSHHNHKRRTHHKYNKNNSNNKRRNY